MSCSRGRALVGRALGMVVGCGLVLAAGPVWAQQTAGAAKSAAKKDKNPANAGPLGEYRSARFWLRTDLPAAEADELLGRLETMLDIVSGYWGRPSRGVIQCYVVKDRKNWPAGSMGGGTDEERGRLSIDTGGGVTMTHTLGYGEKNGKLAEIVDAKAVVFAVADHGTPQHEAVHAYCGQTFGRTGPVWYSEGMAEMGQYWRKNDDKSVHIHPVVLEYLKKAQSEVKSLKAIINNKEQTGDSWENYAWRWAVCHMLAYNSNYSDRFRPLGLGLLTGADTSFEAVYGDKADEICFEYVFFLEHLDNGYRVDLCSFDWKKKFIQLRAGSPLTSKILADHGYQPSQAIVSPDEEYEYTATGSWQLGKEEVAVASAGSDAAANRAKGSKDSPRVTAAGDATGRGRLEGVILRDYKLSAPFDLGERGDWKPAEAGQLWLRCKDKWNELADNKGTVTFKIKVKK